MDRKAVVSLSSTGVGKSTLGNTITGHNHFNVSSDPSSETKETIGKDGVFKGLPIHFIDSPGINDSDGMDSQHIHKLVVYLRSLQAIHGVLIALNYQDPRLSSSLKDMLKLFCYIFRSSQFPRSVGFIFTHSFRTREEVKQRKQQEVTDVFKQMLAAAGMTVPPQEELIPCFFLDNNDTAPTAQNEEELTRLKDWIASLSPLRTDLLNHADPQFEKIEEETRQVVAKTETVQEPRQKWDGDLGKIFGKKKTVWETVTRYTTENVQTGTKTTKFHEEQKRLRKTTWGGQTVHTEWETVRAWQTVQ
ncbi:hypothetical protein QOT17_017718 [Balamuthia mandrillaris]